MKWQYQHNVISELILDDQNYIFPWGVETADSSAFFSLEEGIGYRHTIDSFVQETNNNQVITKIVCTMKEGKWSLVCTDTFSENGINRKAQLECLTRSVFMDFVMRFRFNKHLLDRAWIADKWYEHKNTNIYNQHTVGCVKLSGKKNFSVTIANVTAPDAFKPMMYIRDRLDEWIVHARMVPEKASFNVIKMCNKYMGTRPIPRFLSRALLSSGKIKKILWYRGERSPYKSKLIRGLNPCAFPMVELDKGTILKWDVDVRWD